MRVSSRCRNGQSEEKNRESIALAEPEPIFSTTATFDRGETGTLTFQLSALLFREMGDSINLPEGTLIQYGRILRGLDHVRRHVLNPASRSP